MGEALEFPLLLGRRETKEKPSAVAVAGAEDEALVQSVAEGSDAAFETLFERYRDRVFQFVLWQLGAGRDLAEELTQEVFFQLYLSASTFRHRSRFRTWLYSLARNVCRHHERKHRRESGALRWGEDNEAPVLSDGGRSDALERLTAAEDRARVRQAVAALPREQRAALLLRDWEELSYQEIAAVLDIPVGTVRSRLHNARCALAHTLSARKEDRCGL
jgi:RNA polymerase sigma-70 factor (ECF subfamily)